MGATVLAAVQGKVPEAARRTPFRDGVLSAAAPLLLLALALLCGLYLPGPVQTLLQGIVEIIRCVICLRTGAWPARDEDVEEVDVDKLKEMVDVKDEDIQALDKYVLAQQEHKS